MTTNEAKNTLSSNIVAVTGAILFSGICWYFGNGFSGNYWFLVWIAPIPVIYWSLRLSAKAAFVISFIAYLIGRLSWFSFLVSVATLIPAIIFTLLLPLLFSIILLLSRRVILRSAKWWVTFAFPVLWTAFEFLVLKYSKDGTAGSIAHSQSNLVPLIQIASVAGIIGITFIITLFPSMVAVCWYYRQQKNRLFGLTIIPSLLILSVFIFGIIRVNDNKYNLTIKAGIAVIDETFHHITDHPILAQEIQTTLYYSNEIKKCAAEGAQFVVLPERAVNINKETDSAVMSVLTTAAKENHVTVVTGFTNFRNTPARNSAMIIDADGHLVKNYNKVHLVTGLENQFAPGNQICVFPYKDTPLGVAICKDMDFPYYIRQYGIDEVKVLFIPAWDFVKDDWLHARMAMLRGVENGFSEVRAARQGRLTITDATGHIKSEASSSKGHSASITGDVPVQQRKTLYSRFGEWFGIVVLIVAVFFIVFPGKRKRDVTTMSL